MAGKFIHDPLDEGRLLLLFDRDVGGLVVAGEQIDELRAVVVAADRGGQARRRTALATAVEVAGLVGRDREQPGLEGAIGVEGVGGEMDLQERVLKDVLRGGAVAEESSQEVQDLGAIPLEKLHEGVPIAFAIGNEQFLVRAIVHRRHRPLQHRLDSDVDGEILAAATTGIRTVRWADLADRRSEPRSPTTGCWAAGRKGN